jgi:hypothetical protein
MGAIAIQQMADRIAALMQERLGARGPDLAARVRHAGRRLPRGVRTAVERLAAAAAMAQNPKLLLQIDEAQVAHDYDLALRHLGAQGAADRRLAALGRVASVVATALLAALAVALALMWWRGLI